MRYLPTYLIAVAFGLFAPALWAQAEGEEAPAEEGGGAVEGEEGGAAVEGEGGGEDEFESGGSLTEEVVGTAEYQIEDAKKPITDVTLKPFEPVDSLISRREQSLEKRLPSQIEKDLADVIKLQNTFARKPIYPSLLVPEVNLPIRKISAKVDGWAIEIYNSSGSMLRKFEGKGRPPREIAWDGRDDGGNPALTPGELYQYRLILNKKSGAQRKEISEPFRIEGYSYDHKGSIGVVVSAKRVFEKGRDEFTSEAEERLHELLNVVKSYYTGQGQVEVKVYTNPQYLAESRGNAILNFMMENAAVDPKKVSVTPGFFEGTGPKYERIEVTFR